MTHFTKTSEYDCAASSLADTAASSFAAGASANSSAAGTSAGSLAAAGTAANGSETIANRRLLWVATILVGAVFFFVGHNFQVSQYERFAPWSDAAGTIEAAGQNVVKGIALSLIGLLGLYLVFRRNGRPIRTMGWLPGLMIFYLAWSALSILWSIDPAMSCRRFAVLTFCVMGAVGFARQFRPRDIAWMALMITAAYLVIGVGTELALGTFRPWSPDYRFAGTVHPNTQGAFLAVLCAASFCLARSASRETRWLWTLFAVGLIFLLLTKSRTSCAGLAIALTALWLVHISGRTRLLAVAAAGFVICTAMSMGSLLGIDVDDKLADAAMLGRHEASETLTGRIPIWEELLNYVQTRPFQGYGYESFWTAAHIEAVRDELEWPLREAHNAFIDSTLSVGLIGMATLLAAVLFGLRRVAVAYRATGDPGFAFTLCILIFGIVNAFLESGMMGPTFITLMAGSGVMQLLAIL